MERAWSLLFGKPPTAEDLSQSQAYLDEQTRQLIEYHRATPPAKGAPAPNPPREALASLFEMLCSSNRFLYVE